MLRAWQGRRPDHGGSGAALDEPRGGSPSSSVILASALHRGGATLSHQRPPTASPPLLPLAPNHAPPLHLSASFALVLAAHGVALTQSTARGHCWCAAPPACQSSETALASSSGSLYRSAWRRATAAGCFGAPPHYSAASDTPLPLLPRLPSCRSPRSVLLAPPSSAPSADAPSAEHWQRVPPRAHAGARQGRRAAPFFANPLERRGNGAETLVERQTRQMQWWVARVTQGTAHRQAGATAHLGLRIVTRC